MTRNISIYLDNRRANDIKYIEYLTQHLQHETEICSVIISGFRKNDNSIISIAATDLIVDFLKNCKTITKITIRQNSFENLQILVDILLANPLITFLSVEQYNQPLDAITDLLLSDLCYIKDLEICGLDFENMEAFENVLEQSTFLRSVLLSGTKIKINLICLGNLLKKTKELKSLDIVPNNTENLEYFTDALAENKTLTSLTIDSMNLPNLDSFAKVLTFNTTLLCLILSYNKIEYVGQKFADALEYNITLIELSLSDNNIIDIDLLFGAVFRNICLNKLELINCDIKRISALDELKTNKSLTQLNLANNEIKNIEEFVEALTYNTCLTNLNLNINETIDPYFIVDMLKYNVSLTNFNDYESNYNIPFEHQFHWSRQCIYVVGTRLCQNKDNQNNRTCTLFDLFIDNSVL